MKLDIRSVYKNSDGRWRAYCKDENNKKLI